MFFGRVRFQIEFRAPDIIIQRDRRDLIGSCEPWFCIKYRRSHRTVSRMVNCIWKKVREVSGTPSRILSFISSFLLLTILRGLPQKCVDMFPSYRWWVNNGCGNGLAQRVTKPWSGLMFGQDVWRHILSLGHDQLTHLPLVPHICVSESGQPSFR